MDDPSFQENKRSGGYAEIYQLEVTNVEQSGIPQELKPVLDKYNDVLPEQLSNEMPPTRSVKFEYHVTDAVSSSRATLRF